MSRKSREQKRRKKAAEAGERQHARPAEQQQQSAEHEGEPEGEPAQQSAAEPSMSRAAKRRAQKKRSYQKKVHANAHRSLHSKSSAPNVHCALMVLHEDPDVLAVNKPPGMVCHPCPGFLNGGTVIHALEKRQRIPGFSPLQPEMLEPRVEPTGEDDSFIPRAVVHRLDRGTTGVLLLAKTAVAEVGSSTQYPRRHPLLTIFGEL